MHDVSTLIEDASARRAFERFGQDETGRRMNEAVGGEGQGSATLSLINRATLHDYLE